MPDYLIPADVITAAAEAMEDEAIRCLGRDLGTVHRDDIAAAALGAALPGLAAAGLLTAQAGQDRLADLTARLVAADGGWCLTYGDERADPAYIRWLARHIDAFADHASLAAPADDEATVRALVDAMKGTREFRAGVIFGVPNDAVDLFAEGLARAALAALREGQQK